MRDRVAQFDLDDPQDVWDLEGCTDVHILFRNRATSLGWLRFPLRHAAVLAREELAQVALDAGFTDLCQESPTLAHGNPGITVVVCTRDRPLILRRCLASLRKLKYENVEVLIVDNASRGNETRELVADTGFRYLREDRPGLDWARNCGLQSASYDLIAYTDDDVTVDYNWLNAIASAFANPQVACVTGLVCPMELETPAQILFEENGGMRKGNEPKLFDPQRMKPKQLIAAHWCGVGANMAFRREVLVDLGGFDVHLDVGTPSHGSGDLDIFHRTLAAGKVIRYEPNAVIWHQHRRSMPALHKQFYDNGRAFGCYLLKILSNSTAQPLDVLTFAAKDWFGGWLLAGERKGRTFMLVAAEFLGALHSPWAYWKTYGRLPLLSRVP
jgi:glycosyltransferase involved in cell wall biosynthesis